MTKLFSTIAVALLATSFVACGPSAEEKAKMEEAAKRAGDSISAALSASLEGAMNEATTAVDSTVTTAVEATTDAAAHATEHAAGH